MDLLAIWANSYRFSLGFQLGHNADLRVVKGILFFCHRFWGRNVWSQIQTPFLFHCLPLKLLLLLHLSFDYLFLFELHSLPAMYAPEEDPNNAQDDDWKDDKNQDFLEIDADIVSTRGFWSYINFKRYLHLLLLSRKQSKDTSID
jgi:hypothetical protein